MTGEVPLNTPGRDELAAEYALGVLSGAEREHAEKLALTDREFALAVARWQQTLSPLADEIAGTPPPAAVKQALERRLSGFPDAREARWYDSLLLWRAVALAASVAALMLGFALVSRDTGPGPLIAAINTEAGAAQYVAHVGPGGRTLTLARLDDKVAPAAGRDHELWLVEGGNAPVSLGVIGRSAKSRLTVPAGLAAKIAAGAILAISDEPLGGSPTGKATGPVIALGPVRDL